MIVIFFSTVRVAEGDIVAFGTMEGTVFSGPCQGRTVFLEVQTEYIKFKYGISLPDVFSPKVSLTHHQRMMVHLKSVCFTS